MNWTLDALDVATEGMQRVEESMQTTLESLQKEVQRWMIGQIVASIFSVLTSVASMASNPLGAVGLADQTSDLVKLGKVEGAFKGINVHATICYEHSMCGVHATWLQNAMMHCASCAMLCSACTGYHRTGQDGDENLRSLYADVHLHHKAH